ncbi:MAG: transposase [Desulfobacteraceae bacterium]|nr:transposase [Desulfobacteraceae bacterium]
MIIILVRRREKGQTPVVRSTGARFSINMMAAISTRGHLRFMIVKETIRAKHVCDFLGRLMHNAENPIFLIWNGHPVHKARKVQKCI